MDAVQIESRNGFYSIIPMAFPANVTETESMLNSHPQQRESGLLVFPESRENKIKMDNQIH